MPIDPHTESTEKMEALPGKLVRLHGLSSARGAQLNGRFAMGTGGSTGSADRVAVVLLSPSYESAARGGAALSISVKNIDPSAVCPPGAVALAHGRAALATADSGGDDAIAIAVLRAFLQATLLGHAHAMQARRALAALLSASGDVAPALDLVAASLAQALPGAGKGQAKDEKEEEEAAIRRTAQAVLDDARAKRADGAPGLSDADVLRAEETVRSLGGSGGKRSTRKKSAAVGLEDCDPDLAYDLALEEMSGQSAAPVLPPPPGCLVLLRGRSGGGSKKDADLGVIASPPFPDQHGALRVAVHLLPARVGRQVGPLAVAAEDVIPMQTRDAKLCAELETAVRHAGEEALGNEPHVVPLMVRAATRCVVDDSAHVRSFLQSVEQLGLRAEEILGEEHPPDL